LRATAPPVWTSVLARLTPLTITMIPRAPIGNGGEVVWREPGLLQHSPQIHHGTDLDVLAMRCGEYLGLRAERDLELAVVFVSHVSNGLQQRE
jgi:hypothetical protein